MHDFYNYSWVVELLFFVCLIFLTTLFISLMALLLPCTDEFIHSLVVQMILTRFECDWGVKQVFNGLGNILLKLCQVSF